MSSRCGGERAAGALQGSNGSRATSGSGYIVVSSRITAGALAVTGFSLWSGSDTINLGNNNSVARLTGATFGCMFLRASTYRSKY
jgi:hypothetical protein